MMVSLSRCLLDPGAIGLANFREYEATYGERPVYVGRLLGE